MSRSGPSGLDRWEATRCESFAKAKGVLASRGCRTVDVAEGSEIRIFALSDVHADHSANLGWIEQAARNIREGRERRFGKAPVHDALLLAGDISSSLETIRKVLDTFKGAFDTVAYTVGNHEMWCVGGEDKAYADSFDKLAALIELCDELGVDVRPVRLRCGREAFPIVPLQSWYHGDWDTEPELPEQVTQQLYANVPSFERRWSDFRFCRWPPEVIDREAFVRLDSAPVLAEAFGYLTLAACGTQSLEDLRRPGFWQDDAGSTTHPQIFSLSHFLPKKELCPEKRFLVEPLLSKVVGSQVLEQQVEQLSPDVHVFGHSHIPYDLLVGGIRYVQWPLGYPREQARQCHRTASAGPLCLFSTSAGLHAKQTTYWGQHYEFNERDPSNTTLAPWVIEYARERSRRMAPPGS